MNNVTRVLREVKDYVAGDKDILSMFLFGSHARNGGTASSDLDICLALNSNSYSSVELSEKKLNILKEFPYDIQIFQQLPIYLKIRVLKEGRIVFCRDEDMLYSLACSVITEYSDFEHILKDYLKEVESVG